MKHVGKMTSTLVLVSSPFQYLCAIELIKCYDICGEVVVVDGSAHCVNSVAQLSALYAKFPPTRVIYPSLIKHGDLSERIASYSWIPNEFITLNFGAVLIGDIREQWMQDIACSVNSQEIVLVDDGAASLVLHDFVLKPENYLLPLNMYTADPARRELAHKIKKSQGLVLQKKKVSIFSIYDFGSASVGARNKFNTLTSNFSIFERDEWHFIGSPVVEKGIISQALYNKVVEDALATCSVACRPVYYVHRSEDVALKLSYLNQLGYEVRKNELPYELHLAEQSLKPRWICGMHSTSLFNIKIMFGLDFPARCYVLSTEELDRMKKINWCSDHYSLHDHIVSIYSRLDEFRIEQKHFN